MKNIKSEKGSLALFVTIAMLFFMAFLLALFLSTTNEQKTQLAVTARIKETYEQDLDNVNEIYNSFVGTEEYIPIYTSEQLKKVGTEKSVYVAEVGKYYTFNLDSNYILKNNIELNKYTVAEDGTITFTSNAEQWTPIGTSEKSFTGIFDGNGYKISGLYINDASLGYQGLFGYNNGTIQNITMDKGYINVAGYFGTIVSQNLENGIIDGCINRINVNCKNNSGGICATNKGKLINCKNEGNLNNNGVYTIAGICGQTSNKNAIIQNCVNIGKITGKESVGGIAGYVNGGTVQKCYNKGNVVANAVTLGSDGQYRPFVGGIVGSNCGNIIECYNEGQIEGNGLGVAGIAGASNYGENCLIEKCYNTGKIIDTVNQVGGIVGTSNKSTIINMCYNLGEINGTADVGGIIGWIGWSGEVYVKNSYNLGAVKSTTNTTYVGGIGGRLYYGSIENCYNIGTVYVLENIAGNGITGNGNSDYTREVKNCYYLADTATGGINGADVTGQVEAKTAVEMRSSDFVTLLNNGEDNWKIVAGKNNDYPILSWQN